MKMKKRAALAALLLAVGAATGATAEVAVNDHVFFGHYEQDNDLTNGAEAIEWRVLKVENGEALLISQYALDSQPYNEKYAVALWSECTLRTWLNTDFYDAAFNDTEKQGIVTKELENWKDVNTQDTVSLLDNDEAKTLFENHADRMTVPTAYAIAQGAWQSQEVWSRQRAVVAAFPQLGGKAPRRLCRGKRRRNDLRRQQHGPRG